VADDTGVKEPSHALKKIAVCLGGIQPPGGAFDLKGAWEQRYAMRILYPDVPGMPAKGRKAAKKKRAAEDDDEK
jgi:hypothetical protein